jgi:hypothetical protein
MEWLNRLKGKKIVIDEGISTDKSLIDLGNRYLRFIETGTYVVSVLDGERHHVSLLSTQKDFESNERLRLILETSERAFALSFLKAFVLSAKEHVVAYDARRNVLCFDYTVAGFMERFKETISFLELFNVTTLDLYENLILAKICQSRLQMALVELYAANRDILCELGYPCHGITPFTVEFGESGQAIGIIVQNEENMNPHKANTLYNHTLPRADFMFDIPETWI